MFVAKMKNFKFDNFIYKLPKKTLSLIVIINFFTLSFFDSVKPQQQIKEFELEKINVDYLNSKNELKDYIIDTGDVLSIKFFPAKELNSYFTVNEEGDILLPKINDTYVRGLTIIELKDLLERKFSDYLISPKIDVRLAKFKSLRVLITGEVRNPGLYRFPSYNSKLFSNLISQNNQNSLNLPGSTEIPPLENIQQNSNLQIKRTSENITTISNVIREAGGITSKSDLSKIEIIRDIPLGQGGGKKKATIDFTPFINNFDPSNDIRVFDGDSIKIPSNNQRNMSIVPKSIISGLSPKFIFVDIYGRIDRPGNLKLPLEASLSDAIEISGPIKPLSGKVSILRYENDGSFTKKLINYSPNSKKGSPKNPYIQTGDIIAVRNSFLGKSTEIIREVTMPFVGIYSTKQLIENF